MKLYFFTLPNLLTLFRLSVVPFLFPIFIVSFWESTFLAHLLFGFFYFLICLTDFFDGYIARYCGQVTRFGALLDPLADKLVLLSTLIALVAVGRLYYYWAIILIGREFFVTGMRLIAAEYCCSVKVNLFGKIKTVLQDVFILFLIMIPIATGWLKYCEYSILLLVMLYSLTSAYCYYHVFIENFKKIR